MIRFLRFLKRHKCLTGLLVLFIIGLAAYIFHRPILNGLGAYLVLSEPLEKADIIRVLGGSPDRYLFGTDLYKRGFGNKLVFSFWDDYLPLVRRTTSQLIKEYTQSQGIPEDALLILEGISTYQEALITKDLIESEGFRSVMVVSSPYHMRRASIIFDHVIGDRAKLIYVAVPPGWTDFRVSNWWQDEESAVSVLHEYVALVYYYFKYFLF